MGPRSSPFRLSRAVVGAAAAALWIGCDEDRPEPGEPSPAPVATVTLNLESDTVVMRNVVQLDATLRDADGNELEDRTIVWSTSDAFLATVQEGRVQTKALGVVRITATSEGRSATATLTVAPLVAVSRRLPTTFAGDTTLLVAALSDADGHAIGRSPDWSSSDEDVATVASDGIVTGVSPGRATITASLFGGDGSVELVVLDPTPRPNRELTYVRWTDRNELRRVGSDGSGALPLGDPARTVGYYDWSAAGDRLAVSYYHFFGEGKAALHTMNADGSDPRELLPDSVYRPRWSPDGRQLVFELGIPGRIHVINADGTGLRPLTPLDGYHHAPQWSPDGRRIGFRMDTLAGIPHSLTCGWFWLVDADGSHLERVVLPIGVCDHTWSPDGKLIAFFSGQSPDMDGVWVMSSEGTNARPVTANCSLDGRCGGPRGYRYPQWSPDAKRLAYSSWSTTSFQRPGDPIRVHVSNILGTDAVEFPVGSAVSEDVAWSPDGTRLAYSVWDALDALPSLVVSQADGGGQVPVAEFELASFPVWRR